MLDFGLAKPLVESEPEATTLTGASLTAPGAVVGTLAYMAPEQLTGRPADARSDVWALGVVLYEMASGARPFAGKTGYELSSAILSQPPTPLPTDVPEPLAAVVERCLAKDPARRYARAGEVRSALEALRAGGASTSGRPASARRRRVRLGVAAVAAAVAVIAAGLGAGGIRRLLPGGVEVRAPIRLAVLPFANLAGERYKEGDTPVDQIGRELKVDYVLEGNLQREANRVRITAELVHARDQTQLWAETYERELSGLLALRSEVAKRVATALALELLPAEQARLANVRMVDPEAYQAFLKATQYRQSITPSGYEAAERYYTLALEKDPTYAAAWAGLARVWAGRQQVGITPPLEAGPRAKAWRESSGPWRSTRSP